MSTGTSSRKSSSHTIRRGRITKRNPKKHRDKYSSSTSSSKRRATTSRTKTSRKVSTSSSSRNYYKTVDWGAATSSHSSSPDLTIYGACSHQNSSRRSNQLLNNSWSESMDLSAHASSTFSKIGILKAQNSGPTCDMPVRFQLPDSGRIVYPSKSFQDYSDCTCSSACSTDDEETEV